MLPRLADADRCTAEQPFEPGAPVRCSHARGHDWPRWQGITWHFADAAPRRAAWPDKPAHCPSMYVTTTASGPVRVWCGLDPGHPAERHEGVSGGMPTYWYDDQGAQ